MLISTLITTVESKLRVS